MRPRIFLGVVKIGLGKTLESSALPSNMARSAVYSALGIDWKKEISNTPSKRVYRYVDPLGATEPCIDDEIEELFV